MPNAVHYFVFTLDWITPVSSTPSLSKCLWKRLLIVIIVSVNSMPFDNLVQIFTTIWCEKKQLFRTPLDLVRSTLNICYLKSLPRKKTQILNKHCNCGSLTLINTHRVICFLVRMTHPVLYLLANVLALESKVAHRPLPRVQLFLNLRKKSMNKITNSAITNNSSCKFLLQKYSVQFSNIQP